MGDCPNGWMSVLKIKNAIPFNGESGPVIDVLCLLQPLAGVFETLLKAMLVPIIGLPYIEGSRTDWVAFSGAANEPYSVLVGEGGGLIGVPSDPGIYWTLVVPISIAILVIGTAFTGIKAGTMSAVEVQQQFRRLGVAFLACFFWLPFASLALRFFHKLSMFIAVPSNDPSVVTQGFVDVISGSIVSLGLIGGALYIAGPIILPVLLVAVLAGVAVVVMRWVLVVLLTVSMPLIAAFWALDVWPLNRFSQMASSASGVYVGLLVSGLPTAMLVRVVFELSDANASFISNGPLLSVYEGLFSSSVNPILTLLILFLPIYVIKTTISTTRWAAGQVGGEVAETGTGAIQRGGRYMMMHAAVEEGTEDAVEDYQRSMNEYYRRGP
jgi:hypothetical protein